MSGELDELRARLSRDVRVSEFTIERVQRRRIIAALGESPARLESAEARTRVRVFVDSQSGRGEAEVQGAWTNTSELADLLVSRAKSATGPLWSLPGAAAPARVRLADEALLADPRATADRVLRSLREAWPTGSRARAVSDIEDVRVITSAGFDARYTRTQVGLMATARTPSGPFTARRWAGRESELDVSLPQAIPQAELAPGLYELVIEASAYGDVLARSIFGALTVLADAETQRRGLSPVRLGQRVASSSMTVYSDGTRDFGTASRPFDADGCATRRFAVVANGELVGLGLGAREAALARRQPNGGLANLIVDCERAEARELATPGGLPLLRITELGWLRVDQRSAAVHAGIRAARLTPVGGGELTVGGGSIRISAEQLFSAPLGSAETVRLPWLEAPAALRLGPTPVRA